MKQLSMERMSHIECGEFFEGGIIPRTITTRDVSCGGSLLAMMGSVALGSAVPVVGTIAGFTIFGYWLISCA